MSRRLLTLVSLLVATSAPLSSVMARSNVIAQASSKQLRGAVYLSRGLVPGHTYRIDITASGHQPFEGNGFEQLLYVQSRQLQTQNQSLSFSGTTPRSFPLSQPVSGRVSQWALAVNIQLRAGRGLTVRVVDTGHHT